MKLLLGLVLEEGDDPETTLDIQLPLEDPIVLSATTGRHYADMTDITSLSITDASGEAEAEAQSAALTRKAKR